MKYTNIIPRNGHFNVLAEEKSCISVPELIRNQNKTTYKNSNTRNPQKSSQLVMRSACKFRI